MKVKKSINVVTDRVSDVYKLKFWLPFGMSLLYFQRMARRSPRFIGLNLQLNRNWPFIEQRFIAAHDQNAITFAVLDTKWTNVGHLEQMYLIYVF